MLQTRESPVATAPPRPIPRLVQDAPVTAAANAEVSALLNQAANAVGGSEVQREGDWAVRVRAAVRAPEILGRSPAIGDFVVVVFAATHVDEGQGRFDKATFELHELGGDRIAEHDEAAK